jgi:cell division protein FtsB
MMFSCRKMSQNQRIDVVDLAAEKKRYEREYADNEKELARLKARQAVLPQKIRNCEAGLSAVHSGTVQARPAQLLNQRVFK